MNAKTADLRPALRKTYLYVVKNWAVDADEVAKATGVEKTEAVKLLKRLQTKGLLDALRVNDEKVLTYQSYENINDDPQAMPNARKAFDAAYPKGEIVSAGAVGRKGATGPRYTQKQIAAGLKARAAGKKNAEVAAAAGVKSPAYFSKTLKKVAAAQAAAKTLKKAEPATKRAAKARRVRTSAK